MKKIRLTEKDLQRIVKRVITEQETNTDKLFTITGILANRPDRLLTNIGGKDTYIKLRLNILRDKCMDCTLPIGKEITVRGYTENGAPPSSSNELIVDESGFPRKPNNRNSDKEPTDPPKDNTPLDTIYHISMGENWDRGYDHKSDLFFKDYDKAVEYLTSNGYEKSKYPSFNSNVERWDKGYGYQATLTPQKLIV